MSRGMTIHDLRSNLGFEPQSRLTQTLVLQEALSIKRKALGEVPFKESKLSDPHIREIVNAASKKLGVPASEIDAKIKNEVKKIESFREYSYIIYDTVAKNMVANAAFYLVKTLESDPAFQARRVIFKMPVFAKLVKMVELEHRSFFPLRSPIEHNYIYHIAPITVPTSNPKLEKFNVVPTAAVYPTGQFVFNVNFMQKLLDYAVAEKLTPLGKKYASNGGPIPDPYAYIEFLIIHEMLHYTYGDFAAGNRLKSYSHKEHNWASDFRSNYMLVKSGYEQLPFGLFSDHINYDRQGTYEEMVRVVHDELKKLPKNKQKEFEEMAELDEHPQSDDEDTDQTGENKPREPSQDDIHREVQKKMGERQEIGSDEEMRDREEGSGGGRGRGGSSGKDGMGGLKSRAEEIAQVKPTISWKNLIKQMITSAGAQSVATSYQRPGRKTISGIDVAATTGAMAVKPGEKLVDEPYTKICLVFDTSGSMYHNIPTVMAEAQSLLKQLGKLSYSIGLVFFSDSTRNFQVNIGDDRYAEVPAISDLASAMPKNSEKGWRNLLTLGSTGGTYFSKEMTTQLGSLAAQDWNIIVFSDSDILGGDNWHNFNDLWSAHKANVSFIADTDETWKRAIQESGHRPGNWTHL
jgi:predicted metal-dependent peptidase